MKISGFTFLRNTSKLYYPVIESIKSALPIVDEFIIALGKGEEDDDTEQKIHRLNSDKIKIIHTEWDLDKFKNATEYAHQTDIAKDACSGDWLIYIQGDELIHENDYDEIKAKCNRYLDDKLIEGFYSITTIFMETIIIISEITVGIQMKLELFVMTLKFTRTRMHNPFVEYRNLMVLAIIKKKDLLS